MIAPARPSAFAGKQHPAARPYRLLHSRVPPRSATPCRSTEFSRPSQSFCELLSKKRTDLGSVRGFDYNRPAFWPLGGLSVSECTPAGSHCRSRVRRRTSPVESRRVVRHTGLSSHGCVPAPPDAFLKTLRAVRRRLADAHSPARIQSGPTIRITHTLGTHWPRKLQ